MYYGGGGGGGTQVWGNGGPGGQGGGGAGRIQTLSIYATPGTNGLGGGGGGDYREGQSATGGSGTVIIRYVDPSITANGFCGSANGKTYGPNDTSFGTDNFCSIGNSNPVSIPFPSKGASVNWTCVGQNGGSDASCSANRTEAFSQWNFEGPTTIGQAAQLNDVLDVWGSNNGILSSSAPVVQGGVDCINGKCLRFDGNNYVQVADSASLSLTTGISVEYWVKRTFDSGGYHILKQDSFGGLKDLGGNTFVFWSYHGANDELIFTTDKIPLNSWHHIVLTWTPGIKKIYVDGVLVGQKNDSTTVSLGQGAAPLIIGNSLGWHANNFKGSIDQISIYNKAITVAEIENNYYAGLKKMYAKGDIILSEYARRKGICF
ncbi:MAG: hypothetical protein BWY21_01581 [Parcubacteria group bacterium ADurb.Bin216]|nr:MAG: hypothetical protein BWY21_01581 [Parcubacteria group bacterium ADurb.Bin216]